MRWVINAFAAFGFLCAAAIAVVVLIAALARHTEKRRRRDSQDALIAQYISEGSPAALVADRASCERWAQVQGLDRIRTPKGWR